MPGKRSRVLLVAVALALLSACSSPGVTPVAFQTPTVALPADRIAFRVITAGGLVPFLYYALESPRLVVYGDGRVIRPTSAAQGQAPQRFDVTTVDPMAVAVFAARAEAQGLVQPSVDYGRPTVTDQASTRVRLQGSGPMVEIGVYALDATFSGGLTGAQVQARQSLRDLIAQAEGLAGDRPRAAWEPDDVTVFELAAGDQPGQAGVPWTGPDPDSFLKPTQGRTIACGHLTGQPARAAYTAALANPGGRWRVGRTVRVFAINPLPAVEGC